MIIIEKRNTKHEILMEALSLFAIYGFDGVSVKEIAKKVGIKDSSIYKHYTSKQEIFDAILTEVSERMQTAYREISMPEQHNLVQEYEVISQDALKELCVKLFSFYLTDDVLLKFRRMLTIEQYRNEQASALFRRFFINDVLEFQTDLFSKLISRGVFIECDPAVMALHFYSPLFLMLYKYDLRDVSSQEVAKHIEDHISAFSANYLKSRLAEP